MIRFSPPAILAAGLFLLLAAEWSLPVASAPPTHPPVITAAAANAPASLDITQTSAVILARPLFSADRRPVRQLDMAVDDTLPRLSAIIVIGGTRCAIFAASGQKPQLVAQGGQISGYQLKTVAPDSVDLLGPDGLVTLRPQFINAPVMHVMQ